MRPRSVGGWVGLAALAAGVAAFAGGSAIATYRLQAIIGNPCAKDHLGEPVLETWLIRAAAVLLIVAVGAFVAVLISAARHRVHGTTTHAWVGLAVALVLLMPIANVVAGDPLGFDAQMLPDCATMSTLNGVS